MTNQVGNKNIDNASGQVVRLDIQNTVKAVATHNFGPRNSAGTILPCEFLADDTTNKLLIRKSSGGDQANPNPTSGTAADFFEVGDLDTANLGLLPKTGGTLTGVLQLPTGSQSAPALNVGDTGTGLFKPSSNVLGITADGTKKLTVNSTATEFFGNATNGAKVRLSEASNNGSSYVELKAADSISNNLLLTLPTTHGTSGQALITDGSSGNLSFGDPSVGAANLTGNTLASGVTASSLTSVGTLTALAVTGTCSAGTFSGSGASLTNIPAGQLTGTVADDRITSLTASKLTGALPALDGSALTGLTTLVRQVKQGASASESQSDDHDNFTDKVSITLTNVSANSIVLLFYRFVHEHSNTNTSSKCETKITGDSLQGGNRTFLSGSGPTDVLVNDFAVGTHSTTGDKTYKIQFKESSSGGGVARIKEAYLLGIEIDVS